jgi:hypothetical protein
MRLEELMPLLLLLTIPAQLLSVMIFHLLTRERGGRTRSATRANVVPFKTAGVTRWTRL